jgi:lipopolysaccharide transport system permease protein
MASLSPTRLPRLPLDLLWQFTKRDIQTRYRGSVLGIGWALLGPLLMLGVFTLVFHGLFQMRWPVSAAGVAQVDFALQVFTGLLLFGFFAEVANRSPHLVTSQSNLVTKVVFPLHVLSVSAVLSAGFQTAVGATLLMLFTAVLVGPSLTWLALPLAVLPLALCLLALSWFLAALGVYLRDVAQMMAMLTTLMMFLSPVFYPLATVPERWQPLYLLNPLTRALVDVRGILFAGQWPAWEPLAVFTALAAAACVAAWGWFAWLRRGFADVL